MYIFRGVVIILTLLGVVGCRGDAVVFAPTPPPPDTSPTLYTHPSGAFSLRVPPDWAIREQNAATLAVAAFSPPGEPAPRLVAAAVRLPQAPLNANAVRQVLDQYQQDIRPDVARYTEQSREAMSDGSWRMTGLRASAGGTAPLNTFIVLDSDMVGVVEVLLPTDPAQAQQLEAVVNTFTLAEALAESELATLRFATSGRLEALNVHTWQTAEGIFFVTGEVANQGERAFGAVPVRVALQTADGRTVTQAEATTMGYGVAPGGFVPFSLRFGEGQPPLTTRFTLSVGGQGWLPGEPPVLYGEDVLAWSDSSTTTETGGLRVTGRVTNTSDEVFVYLPRVLVSVFDDTGQVIGAAFQDMDDVEIEPSETLPFELVVPELGGVPSRYIVQVQGQP